VVSASNEASTDKAIAYNFSITLAKALWSKLVATVTKAAIGLDLPILANYANNKS